MGFLMSFCMHFNLNSEVFWMPCHFYPVKIVSKIAMDATKKYTVKDAWDTLFRACR